MPNLAVTYRTRETYGRATTTDDGSTLANTLATSPDPMTPIFISCLLFEQRLMPEGYHFNQDIR